MGLFDRFRKEEKPVEIEVKNRRSIFDGNYPIDLTSFKDVLSACLGKMTAIQDSLIELVGENVKWDVFFSRGTMKLGKKEYPIQLIGSEGDAEYSWMWGWYNLNNFGVGILDLANQTKKKGEAWDLTELNTPTFTMKGDTKADSLSIVACGISREPFCYFKAQHKGGAAYLALQPEGVFGGVDPVHFLSIIDRCLRDYSLNDVLFIESFLMWNGTPYCWEENDLIADFPSQLNLQFEEHDGVKKLINYTFKE